MSLLLFNSLDTGKGNDGSGIVGKKVAGFGGRQTERKAAAADALATELSRILSCYMMETILLCCK